MIEENNAPEEQSAPQISEAAASVIQAMEGLGGVEELKVGLSELGAAPAETVAPAATEAAAKDPENVGGIAVDTLNTKVEDKEEPGAEETVVAEETKEEVVAEETVGEEKKEEKKELTINSPVFGGEKTVANTKVAEKKDLTAELKDTEGLNKIIKDQTGHEDLSTLIESSLNIKERESQVEGVMAENADYKKVFEQIPSELYQSIDLFLKGKDWKTPIISKPNLDFSKTSEDLDNKSLVENYLPGQFSQEEWDDYKSEDADPGTKKAIDLAISSAKTKFELDKTELDSFRSNQVESATKRSKMFKDSADVAIEYLKNNFEGIDDGYVAQAKAELNIQNINDMLFNKDGTFKEDAALRLSYAKHGHDIMGQYKGIVQHQSETSERTEILERTPDVPKQNAKTGSTQETVRPEVKTRIDDLTTDLGQKKYY